MKVILAEKIGQLCARILDYERLADANLNEHPGFSGDYYDRALRIIDANKHLFMDNKILIQMIEERLERKILHAQTRSRSRRLNGNAITKLISRLAEIGETLDEDESNADDLAIAQLELESLEWDAKESLQAGELISTDLNRILDDIHAIEIRIQEREVAYAL